MDLLLVFYAAAVAVILALAALSVWAPRRTRVRLMAVGLVVAMLPAGYAGMSDLLSRPKPATIEWARRSLPEATVVASNLREGKAIYLWLLMPGQQEPRAYVFPWNRNLAKQLIKAEREAKRNGARVRMRRPFTRDKIDDQERQFYSHNHRQLPPKTQPSGGASVYHRPQGSF